jgi:hypothetical protein
MPIEPAREFPRLVRIVHKIRECEALKARETQERSTGAALREALERSE